MTQDEEIQYLKDELHRARSSFDIMCKAVGIARQCIIHWDWHKIYSSPSGELGYIKIEDYLKEVIRQEYRILSVVITEYDDVGFPLHAVIIALQSEKGNLH